MTKARRVVEQVVRMSYGRLLAYLAARTGDVMAAEDALGDALVAALNTWADDGVPPHPEAWLLLVARRKLLDDVRRTKVKDKAVHLLAFSALATPGEQALEENAFPDDRLKLLFVCAHPAIDATIHTPLMLQMILGFKAHQIASAFLVSPATMSQRLVRAKAKIRDAGIAFKLPLSRDFSIRLNAVLEAIYAVYTFGWESIAGSDPRQKGLAEEALWLARLCVQLMPNEPEARGLLALILLCEARRDARRAVDGAYVPLSEQNTALWSREMIQAAEAELARAFGCQKLGRFQLEAAIQSAHVQRSNKRESDWETIAFLYEGLLQLAPTLGALVSHAAAIAEARGFTIGLETLNKIPLASVKNYQPYWALKAHLLQNLSCLREAKEAYQRAIGLSEDGAVREFLFKRALQL
ncbi:MAG: RNA polymerase subunit sigma-70 [Verrucomicrobia bacterium]|nr:RNA polymerase subunit sigma-70 [Leptolyngbya sp. ES-bin-22]